MLTLASGEDQRLAKNASVRYSGATMKSHWVLSAALCGLSACRSYPLPSTPGASASDLAEKVSPTGTLRLKPGVCKDFSLQPETGTLSAEATILFLKQRGLTVHIKNERPDLVYVEVQVEDGKTVRLRVAILENSEKAGEDLHQAMLQQGKGSWGVHRGNIAILAPVGHMDDIITFAVTRTKLACWGVLTVELSDDAIVVPGGYLEL
jgi:hypothetical protein